MRVPHRSEISIAVVRVLTEAGARPVIRVFELSDLFGNDHVVGTTASPEEATELIRRWLNQVIGPHSDGPSSVARNG